MTAGEAGVEKEPGAYRWEAADGTEYVLTDLPDDPCHECGAAITARYCYFREGPRADEGIDHVCWDCGRAVTGFGEPGNNAAEGQR